MTNTTLREKIGQAVHDYACGCDHNPWPLTPNYEQMADAVLAALGLDDLDAAVERGATWANEQYFAEGTYGVPWHRLDPEERDNFRKVARLTLEAALSATEGTDDE